MKRSVFEGESWRLVERVSIKVPQKNVARSNYDDKDRHDRIAILFPHLDLGGLYVLVKLLLRRKFLANSRSRQNPFLDGLPRSKFVIPELQVQDLRGVENVREDIGSFQSCSGPNLDVVDLDGLPFENKQLLSQRYGYQHFNST